MGIFTHHISDKNVHDNGDGTAVVWSALDDGIQMEITKSGYLQPPVNTRANRFLLALIAGFVLLWLRWQVSGSMYIDTFFDIDDYENGSINATLLLMTLLIWLSAFHILVLQRAYLFGSVPGWHSLNSLMMTLFYIIMGCVTIVYIGLLMATLVQTVSQFLHRE